MGKMVKASVLALAAAMLTVPVAQAKGDEPAAASTAVSPKAAAFLKTLHPQTGEIRIPEAKAVMHLGDRYYFLPAAEAKRVLTEAWGNPPEQGDGVLGIVIEQGKTIFDSAWAAVVTYEETGHIADSDAKEQDYAAVLKGMQEGQESANPERTKAGYPAMHLVGWAQPPAYDPASHALIWAKELDVAGARNHSLNYDVRLLGRTGVLSLNMLSEMPLLGNVRTAAESFGKSVTFEPGAAYTDFDAGTDKAADYGLAGLVAGGVALGVAKKVGLLAIFLKFGKVIFLGIAAAAAGGWAFVKRLLGRGREEDVI